MTPIEGDGGCGEGTPAAAEEGAEEAAAEKAASNTPERLSWKSWYCDMAVV